MLKLGLYFLLLLISLVSSDDSKFYFDGFLEKGMSNYELPSSIKLTWFNFLEQGNLLRGTYWQQNVKIFFKSEN